MLLTSGAAPLVIVFYFLIFIFSIVPDSQLLLFCSARYFKVVPDGGGMVFLFFFKLTCPSCTYIFRIIAAILSMIELKYRIQ